MSVAPAFFQTIVFQISAPPATTKMPAPEVPAAPSLRATVLWIRRGMSPETQMPAPMPRVGPSTSRSSFLITMLLLSSEISPRFSAWIPAPERLARFLSSVLRSISASASMTATPPPTKGSSARKS